MNPFFVVQLENGGWVVRREAVDPIEEQEQIWQTVTAAKMHGKNLTGIVPVLHIPNAVDFNENVPIHKALSLIEARHGIAEILMVSDSHYWIRRTRFSTEQPIRYRLQMPLVYARGDFEGITGEINYVG